MSISISYIPLNANMKEGKLFDLYARVKYRMFPELEGEFSRNDYPYERDLLVPSEKEEKKDPKEKDSYEYKVSFELPYGDFSIEYYYVTKYKTP